MSARFISIDIEASGPVPGLYSLLSIGAARVLHRDGRYEVGEPFYAELRPAAAGVDPQAMEVNGLDLDRLRCEGLEPAEAMKRFAGFAGPPAARPVFVAHNAPFDWMFIAHAFASCAVPNPFGHAALDIKALAMGKLGLPWSGAVKKEIARRLPGLPAWDRAKAHRADYDAWYQAHLFAALMNLDGGNFPPPGAS